jgi:hypothetical protein
MATLPSARRSRDLLLSRIVDPHVARRVGRYVAGAPIARQLRSRIRSLVVPGLDVRRGRFSTTITARVPIARTTTPWGFSFHPDGWHPYVATLRALEDGGPAPLPLFDFYAKYTPETIQDVEMKLRLHVFHLLQSVSENSIDSDVGVPARGWHGEAYRGHIFWDELFIFPFLNLRIPELTRSLLMYRYRRLPEARYMAREEGFCGAMYPWQSATNGSSGASSLSKQPLA